MSNKIGDKVYNEILHFSTIDKNNIYSILPLNVFEFFTKTKVTRKIPDYQRPYSWSKKNILDLMHDVQKLASSNEKSWFLGPLFTTKKTENDDISNLLDGQQRVTTIQILLREASLIKYRIDGYNLGQDYSKVDRKVSDTVEDCKNVLYTKSGGGARIPLFKTEESIEKIFSTYILSCSEIESKDDYSKDRKEFYELLDRHKNQGNKTAYTIEEAIKTINKFIDDEFINNSDFDNIGDKYDAFCEFIHSMLFNCWLIEVPLKSSDNSIQIFESINNRGKSLSLVDKLRYKSLIKCNERNTRDLIKTHWKNIYNGLETMNDSKNKYIKNEDDFFKVFFNSIEGDDITDEDEFIEKFEKIYLNSDENILHFLKEVRKVQKFHEYISTILDDKNEFIDKGFENQAQKDKAKAIVQLLRKTIKFSQNSRVLLYNLIRNYDVKRDAYTITQSIWNIVRLVYFVEVYENESSNNVRIAYKKLINEIEVNKTNFVKIIKAKGNTDYELVSTSISHCIKTNNADQAQFILYLFSYLENKDALIGKTIISFKKAQLEHMFAQSWQKHWKNKEYKTEDVVTYIKKDLDQLNFEFINLEKLSKVISGIDDFELRHYKTKPHSQKESLIEFIGNKWVLHGPSNAKGKHYNFTDKKESYKGDLYLKIPTNENTLIGLNKYDDFGYKEIIERSLTIVDRIHGGFYNEWDNIK